MTDCSLKDDTSHTRTNFFMHYLTKRSTFHYGVPFGKTHSLLMYKDPHPLVFILLFLPVPISKHTNLPLRRLDVPSFERRRLLSPFKVETPPVIMDKLLCILIVRSTLTNTTTYFWGSLIPSGSYLTPL